MKKIYIKQAIYWLRKEKETGSKDCEEIASVYLQKMIMSDWSMPELQVTFLSQGSMSFKGTVLYKNEPVFLLENAGKGESSIVPLIPDNRKNVIQFLSDVNDWVKAYGVLDCVPESVWVMWIVSDGTMGRAEADFFDAYKKEFPDSVADRSQPDIGALAVGFFGLNKNPQEVYQTLKVLDSRLHRYSGQYCNGEIDSEAYERVVKVIHKRLTELLGEEAMQKIHLNSDPRGAAIKIKPEFAENWKGPKDWGGYGYFIP